MKIKKTIFLSIIFIALISSGCKKAGGFKPRCPSIQKEPNRIVLHTEKGADGRFWIKDDMGRTIILKGVALGNSSKVPPHIPIWLKDKDPDNEAFDQLHTWGVNSVRMLILWEGLEPERGKCDCSYLDLIEEMVDMAKEKGIMVILDMHQDLFSRFLCGDGAPRWAVNEKYIQEISCAGAMWQALSVHSSVLSAWADFWTDKSMQENLIRTWQEVVWRFRNKANVIGYDLLNEPYQGSLSLDDVETKYMRDFYERLITAIRGLDKDCLILVEPAITLEFGIKTKIGSFPVPNIVFSPHYYDTELMLTLGAEFDRAKDKTSKYLSDFERLSMQNILAPVVIGEYGMRTDRKGYEEYTAHQMIEMENVGFGSMYWTYFRTGKDWQEEDMSLVNHDGRNPLTDEKPTAPDANGKERCHDEFFIRPYPMKIAGELIKYRFDFSFTTTTGTPPTTPLTAVYDYLGEDVGDTFANTKTFTLSFKETGAKEDTEIFVPRLFHYGDDLSGSNTPTITASQGEYKWSDENPNILIWTTNHPEIGAERDISIKPYPYNPPYPTEVLYPECVPYSQVRSGD